VLESALCAIVKNQKEKPNPYFVRTVMQKFTNQIEVTIRESGGILTLMMADQGQHKDWVILHL